MAVLQVDRPPASKSEERAAARKTRVFEIYMTKYFLDTNVLIRFILGDHDKTLPGSPEAVWRGL